VRRWSTSSHPSARRTAGVTLTFLVTVIALEALQDNGLRTGTGISRTLAIIASLLAAGLVVLLKRSRLSR
jgi:hypothetical protein